ncbi:hypothetical protein K435DRAFT_669544, partial [Dendrothele bispora CBS 962.96]
GWRAVRREQRRQFIVFWIISLLLLTSASAIFASPLYIFIFQSWPFFATMTIVSYILIVATTVLGLICRLHFGKGLPEFLKETEDLDGADFAPVYISAEKADEKHLSHSDPLFAVQSLPYVEPPKPVHRTPSQRTKTSSVYSDIMRETVKLSSTPPVAQIDSLTQIKTLNLSAAVPNKGLGVNPSTKIKVGLPSNPKQNSPIRTSPIRTSPVQKPTSGNYF